jgi:phospholipid/cholesterol/gamma-HCH transport system substrate-binding protein
MEKTITQKIQLGIFVIVGLLVFIMAIYFIGDKQRMFEKTNELSSVFNNVNGLQLGNNVRYSGVNVGTVTEIEMISDTIIKVNMIIDKNIFKYIKQDAIATIGSDGLVGNRIVNIIPGKGNSASIAPGAKIQSLSRGSTEDMLNTLDVTNKNAAQLSGDLVSIIKDIRDGKGSLGILVRDSLVAKDIKETIFNLKSTTKGSSDLILKVNKLAAELDRKNNFFGVLRDTTVANNIKTIVKQLQQSSKQINTVITNLNTTVLNAKEGKGAINYLSNDPKLVQKIDSTVTNINAASSKLNENLEALKHNFFFRGYFKKQAKEKEKLKEAQTEAAKKQ